MSLNIKMTKVLQLRQKNLEDAIDRFKKLQIENCYNGNYTNNSL
jgi:hypothetical protein